MARNLKSTGSTSTGGVIAAVDDDDAVKVWTTAGAGAAYTNGAGITVSSVTVEDVVWNGVTRKGMRFGSSSSIVFTVATPGFGSPMCAFIVVKDYDGGGAGNNIIACTRNLSSGVPVNDGTGMQFRISSDGQRPRMDLDSAGYFMSGITTTIAAGDDLGIFLCELTSGDNPGFLGLEGSTISAADYTTTDPGANHYAGQYLRNFGGGISGDILAVGLVNATQLAAAVNAVLQDPIGELFDAPAGSTQPARTMFINRLRRAA